MSITPIVTFKAGRCDVDVTTKPHKVKPIATPGYIYMFRDEFLHFCWRPRSVPLQEPEVDLLMMPTDGHLVEYTSEDNENLGPLRSPTNGRIIMLKFASSSQKYSFWLQSKSQHPSGDPSLFSRRDHRIIDIVNMLLDDQSSDITGELRRVNETEDENANSNNDESRADEKAKVKGGDDDDVERDVFDDRDKTENHGSFLSLSELLSPSNTIPFVAQSCNSSSCDQLLMFLPKGIAQRIPKHEEFDKSENPSSHGSLIQQLSSMQKHEILFRVLRSPQLCQSLESLSLALRRGGLHTVSEALDIDLNNESNPDISKAFERLSAIDVFLDGIKRSVERRFRDKQMI